MTQIEGLGNKVNWDMPMPSPLGNDKDVASSGPKTEDVDTIQSSQLRARLQADAKTDANLTMTAVDSRGETERASGVPPLAAPATQPDGNAMKLQSAVGKATQGNGVKLNDTELSSVQGGLKSLLGAVNEKAPVVSEGTAKMLFDLYAMLCLLAQCAQEGKNAQRELRQAETSALVTSIQNQAEEQKSAAWTGLIAGSIICGAQALAAGISAAKTVSNVKAESAIATETGVKQASTELTQAQAQLKNEMAELDTFNSEHRPPAAGAQPDDAIETQRAQHQEKVTQAKLKVDQKNQALKMARASMMNSDKFTKLKISEARVKGFSEVNMALGNLGQTIVKGAVDIQQAEAMAMAADQKKAEEELAQTKDLMDSFQEIVDQVVKLSQAVLQAENESMHSAIQA